MKKRHPNYSGGAITEPRGYKLIHVGKTHHLADCRGYTYEHRLVAEKILGRRLRPGEVVHHKRVGKANRGKNSKRGLRVFRTNGVHLSEHFRKRTDLRLIGGRNPTIKCACGCGKRFKKYDDSNRPRTFAVGHANKGRRRWWDNRKGAKNNERETSILGSKQNSDKF